MRRHTQLRLCLAATYVAFTAILLGAIGFFFWQHLRHEAELDVRAAVEADWGAAIGFIHLDNQRPEWVYDRNDPDEAYTVERLRHVYLLADQSGERLESSTIFESIGADSASMRRVLNSETRVPEYAIPRDKNGIPYLIRTDWIHDDQSRRYYLAIGRSLAIPYRAADRFVLIYFLLALPTLVLASFFSWWLTGVAMRQGHQAI